ncbi:hypothetical protein [Roseomonas sp. BN140053]|uniref:hypothetical protein n=1 Tax=Roseomonas sp. BN140053 TaxID=3391898 RepID=UPI0039EB2810
MPEGKLILGWLALMRPQFSPGRIPHAVKINDYERSLQRLGPSDAVIDGQCGRTDDQPRACGQIAYEVRVLVAAWWHHHADQLATIIFRDVDGHFHRKRRLTAAEDPLAQHL